MKLPTFKLNPITRKRLKRFRQIKRAWWSLWIILFMYVASLLADFWCNHLPLYVHHNGRHYFPALMGLFGRQYPDRAFTGSNLTTRPNYKALAASPEFTEKAGNFMLWPLVRSGPRENFTADDIGLPKEVTVVFAPHTHIAILDLRSDHTVKVPENSTGLAWFFGKETDAEVEGLLFTDYWPLPGAVEYAMTRRLANQPSAETIGESTNDAGIAIRLELSAFKPRPQPQEKVNLMLRELPAAADMQRLVFSPAGEVVSGSAASWEAATAEQRERIRQLVVKRQEAPVSPLQLAIGEQVWRVTFEREDYSQPFRPVRGHLMGLDSSGRDVFAQLVYGMRIAMSFGLLLVTFSMIAGIAIGAVQGYYGGLFDITAQRAIEIWSALPFLYIMIMMGSVLGQSFTLLLLIYGAFHWIGISYYMRAEFLKLRREQFVEAARVIGIPTWKILLRHILPNALVPVITFFPFSLVGAISVLTALDYLGFGLPSGTPSWGNLFAQAQSEAFAWWLVLYPFLMLFLVILLCVFVGEGVRTAFDPRRHGRME